MPHFVNVKSVTPLVIHTSEYNPEPGSVASLQISHTDIPLHSQPVVYTLMDGSVWIAYFSRDNSVENKKMLISGTKYPQGYKIKEYRIVPVPHIPAGDLQKKIQGLGI